MSAEKLRMATYILNQPENEQLAAVLRKWLAVPGVMRFDALVAFAVSSGVGELKSEIESLLRRGGGVRIVVGVSNRVTTMEGLQLLLELAEQGASVFVFHNDNSANPIFHPKLYLLQEQGKAVLIVGSSNLTGKGLVGNYEISLVQELDLIRKSDRRLVASAEKIVNGYCDVASGLSRPLDVKLLEAVAQPDTSS